MVGGFVGLYLGAPAGANIYVALIGATIECARWESCVVYVAGAVARIGPLRADFNDRLTSCCRTSRSIHSVDSRSAFRADPSRAFHLRPDHISGAALHLGVAVCSGVAWF